MTKEQATELAPLLPDGWLAKTAEKLEAVGKTYSPGMISRVKNGYHENEAIEAALLEVARDERERRAAVSAEIAAMKD